MAEKPQLLDDKAVQVKAARILRDSFVAEAKLECDKTETLKGAELLCDLLYRSMGEKSIGELIVILDLVQIQILAGRITIEEARKIIQ